MSAGILHDRYERFSSEHQTALFRIEITWDGDGVSFRTTDRHVKKLRHLARLSGGLTFAVGIAGTIYLTPWSGLAIFAGLIAIVVAPGLIHPSILLRLDESDGTLTVLQKAARTGTVVSMDHVVSIQGRYEVFGWDPRSVIYLEHISGEQIPVLVLSGTQEELAVFVCRGLGRLLDVPYQYSGTLERSESRSDRFADLKD